MNLDRRTADMVVESLRTFAQPQRLTILAFLLGGERAVGDIETATGIAQPALSQQLAELRRTDMVTTRREARLIYYSIASKRIEEQIRTLFAAFGVAAPMVNEHFASTRSDRTTTIIGAAAFARIG